MSRETIDAARRVMAALGERDFSALVEMADPEVEWHSFFAELGEGGVYRGREACSDTSTICLKPGTW